jgi:hypothetical protein
VPVGHQTVCGDLAAFAVNGTELKSVGSLSLEIEFDRQVHGHVQFYVFEELETDILLGMDVFQKFGIRTNVPDRIIWIQTQPLPGVRAPK